MSDQDYVRQVPLHCPTCGSTEFKVDSDDGSLVELVQCTGCDRSMPKDELIRENSENIQLHVAELSREIADHAMQRFKNALKGSNKSGSSWRFS